MARLLLLPIALLGLAASVAVLGFDYFSAGQGWVAQSIDPRAAGSVRTALVVATVVTVISVPMGALFALGLRGGGTASRGGVLACCALLLLVPQLSISALPAMAGDEDSLFGPVRQYLNRVAGSNGPLVFVFKGIIVGVPTHLFADDALDSLWLMCAIAQATSVVTLFLVVSGGPLPASLIAAARAAGARRIQAWRHAVLAPLAWPLLGAAVAAFLIGLRDGPFDFASPDDLAIFRSWGAIAALLLALASLSALAAALRRRPA